MIWVTPVSAMICHVADYNDATGVEYSVGEYWDGNDKIESWINRTNKKSAAFDFQFRYNVRDAVNGAANGKVTTYSDWSKLNSNDNLMHDANYRRYAVTFVEIMIHRNALNQNRTTLCAKIP